MDGPNPMREIREALGQHADSFNEPLSIELLALARADGLLTDTEWDRVLRFASRYTPIRRVDGHDPRKINVDADPRNADWIRVVRARRYSGRMLPSWAALWIWWLGRDVYGETDYWPSVGRVAAGIGIEPLDEA